VRDTSIRSVIIIRGDKQYNLLTNLSHANTRYQHIAAQGRSADDLLSATLDTPSRWPRGTHGATDEIFYNEQQGA
jgi:hypothetical protein